MSTQRVKSLSKSYEENANLVAKPVDLTYFQLDENTFISKKEIEILPDSYKNQIKEIFLKVLKNKDVLDNVKQLDASLIHIKVQNKKLVYSLDNKENSNLNDPKVQKAFEKVTRNIQRYLENTKTIKNKKIVSINENDIKIVKNRAFDIKQIKKIEKASKNRLPSFFNVPIKFLKKYFWGPNAEFSLWAVFLSDIQTAVIKFFNFLSLEIAFLKNIKGWDDWLGYILGSIGLIDGAMDLRDAKKIDDKEGKYDGIHKIIRNCFAIAGGSIDWIGKAIKTAGHIVLKLALSIIASSVFLFVTLYAMARFIYFDIKAIHFKKKLNEYLKNDKLTEREKQLGALKFLKNKLMVSKNKSLKILKEIREKNPDYADEKIKDLFNEKITKIIKTKVKRFERRIGDNLASVIQRNIKQILKDPTNELNIEKTNKIFENIKYKNWISIHDNTMYSIAIALQGIEILLFIILGFSFPALITGAISTAIFVYIQGYEFYRQHILKNKQKDKKLADDIDQKIESVLKKAI